jgi:hypothetical protein
MNRKLCSKCLKVKDYSQFHKNPASSTGLHPMCADCRNAIRRARNAGKGYSSPMGVITAGGPGTVTLPSAPPAPVTEREMRERRRCINGVNHAMRMGKVPRGARCCVCNRTREQAGGLVAHHEDHNDPRSVVFLCRPCHAITHRSA